MECERAVYNAMTSIFSSCQDLKMKEQEVITDHLRLVFMAGFEEGRKQTAHGKIVLQFKDGREVGRFPDIKTAANYYGVCKSTISKACNGKIKNCLGFQWSIELKEKK